MDRGRRGPSGPFFLTPRPFTSLVGWKVQRVTKGPDLCVKGDVLSEAPYCCVLGSSVCRKRSSTAPEHTVHKR